MHVLLVLCLAFAFVLEEASSANSESTLSCLRDTLKASIDASRRNTEIFLQQLSPRGDISDVWGRIEGEYGFLQQNLDNSSSEILDDRDSCEESNKRTIISKPNCDLLAKMSFVQQGTRHVMALSVNCISIISRAHLNFAKGNVFRNSMQFSRGQIKVLLASLEEASTCFQTGH